jgi:hypothetical protein
MKKQIWKFAINQNKIIVEMPKDAEILTIQTQNETPCILALVNPENSKELRHFEVYETGQDTLALSGCVRQPIVLTSFFTFKLFSDAKRYFNFRRYFQ